MKKIKPLQECGRANVEYGLLLVLVAFAVMGALLVLGPRISSLLQGVSNSVPNQGIEEVSAITGLTNDFISRIMSFYEKNGHWPRSWGDYRFIDLGLNPKDWKNAVEGIIWNPNGDKIGLSNQKGDDLQVYVEDMDGNTRKLYDGWNIWCVASTGKCYFHTVAPGNEVDVSTIKVVEEKKK